MGLRVLRSQLALCRNDSAKAIEELQAPVPYEMGNSMQAIYLRGQTYLALHEGGKAAAEFQKIIDHGWLAMNSVGALARLGLARPMRYRTIPSKSGQHIKIFLRSGKTPILTSRWSGKPRQSTLICCSLSQL